MKKIIAAILAVTMTLSLASCGSTDSSSEGGKSTDTTTATTRKAEDPDNKKENKEVVKVTVSDIEKKIAEAVGKENYLCDVDISADDLELLWEIDKSRLNGFTAKESSVASVNLDKVVVLDCKDGYADEAVKTINEYFAQTVSYIRQYPYGTQKVMQARLYQSGNTVIFVIAGKSAEGTETAEQETALAKGEYEKIDNAIKAMLGPLPENKAVIPDEDDNGGSFGEFGDNGDNGDVPLIGG